MPRPLLRSTGESQAAKNTAARSYIVVFKADAVRANTEARSQRPLVAVAARELARAHGGSLTFVYQHALKGFAVRLPPGAASALAHNPRVAYVEPDQVVQAFPTQSPATWGLDRIDQRDLPLNNTYNYNQTGAGVQAYIIDTGIRATHQQFTGRVGNGADVGRRRPRHERLQRPRHPRRRHDRRNDLRRRQAGHAPSPSAS